MLFQMLSLLVAISIGYVVASSAQEKHLWDLECKDAVELLVIFFFLVLVYEFLFTGLFV